MLANEAWTDASGDGWPWARSVSVRASASASVIVVKARAKFTHAWKVQLFAHCSLLTAQLMAAAPSHSPSRQTLGSIDVGLQIQLKAVIGQYCCGLLRMKEAKKRRKGVQVQQTRCESEFQSSL
jgi:hypothetical protein